MERREIRIEPERIIKYFRSFSREAVGDMEIELRPLPSDIPVFDCAYHDEKADALVVLFKTIEQPIEHKLDDVVSVYLDPKEEKVAGIRVSKLQTLGSTKVVIIVVNDLKQLDSEMKAKALQTKDWQELLKRLGRYNIEKRKLDFFKEELPRVLQEVTA